MTDPRPLSDVDLLVWAVVIGYREQQKRDGMHVLLLPLPSCPTCESPVHDGVVSWVREGPREEVTIDVRPCGHAHRADLCELEKLDDHVTAIHDLLKHQPMRTDDIIREAHARLGQSEATEATETPAPAEPWTQLEARAFNAVQPALNEAGAWLPLSVRRKVARAVLAEILGPLDSGTDTATWTAVRAIQLMNEAGQRRDEAEAAIARVRKLIADDPSGIFSDDEILGALVEQPAPEPCDGRPCTGTGCSHELAAAALATHDQDAGLYTAPTPAATQATDNTPCSCGGRLPLAHLHADQHQPEEQP